MISVHPKLYAILLAATIVFVLSVTGSLIQWMQCEIDGREGHINPSSQVTRWKWMLTVFSILVTIFLMAKP